MTESDITVSNLYGSDGLQPSLNRLRKILNHTRTRYLYLTLRHAPVSISQSSLQRMAEISQSIRCTILYTDYIEEISSRTIRLDDYTAGSVRDDFDMGPGILLHVASARKAADQIKGNHPFAGLYALRLALSAIDGGIYHLPEPLAVLRPEKAVKETDQFAYVDNKNTSIQRDLESAFINYLRLTDALLTRRPQTVRVNENSTNAVASVVIPVYNRVHTISDAIRSALNQHTDFSFNILVVDNFSTDGTTETIRELSKSDNRVILITPRRKGHGIGGCWNEAVSHRLCGTYAVQLDSDDLYSTPDTLQIIVDKFRSTDAAMVVGSYTLTDIDCNPIPPGVIDHKEWTAENGRNNLLRVNGIGAPRAYVAEICRRYPFPDVSYGEDYAMALRISRTYLIERIMDPIYTCRRWEGNSDSGISDDQRKRNDYYKDRLRGIEITARRKLSEHPQK